MAHWRIRRAQAVRGRWSPPGDKSITHRAVILGLLAEGRTQIRNFLEADDCLRTVAIARQLGARIERMEEGVWMVEGVGGALQEPSEVLDAGNSGTTARLMAGVLASAPIFSVLTGDESLRRRPMRRIVEPLQRMGASIDGRQNSSRLPLALRGGDLRALTYHTPVASAQVKSCILLAGLRALGTTEVIEPTLSRDHTERMLSAFGVTVETAISNPHGVYRVRMRGGQELEGVDMTVPGDFSSAAFWIAGALLLPGSDLIVENVGVNPTRIGMLEALAQAGVHLHWEQVSESAGEPIATLRVQAQPLQAMQIGGSLVPRLVDEVPILAVLATQAVGTTEIREASELRVKESDRLATMTEELRKMGAEIECLPDGLRIHGPTNLSGAIVHSHGDHRVAMALAIAGLIAEGETVIEPVECVQTSFPDFKQVMATLVH